MMRACGRRVGVTRSTAKMAARDGRGGRRGHGRDARWAARAASTRLAVLRQTMCAAACRRRQRRRRGRALAEAERAAAAAEAEGIKEAARSLARTVTREVAQRLAARRGVARALVRDHDRRARPAHIVVRAAHVHARTAFGALLLTADAPAATAAAPRTSTTPIHSRLSRRPPWRR